jgi:hypothetical protein
MHIGQSGVGVGRLDSTKSELSRDEMISEIFNTYLRQYDLESDVDHFVFISPPNAETVTELPNVWQFQLKTEGVQRFIHLQQISFHEWNIELRPGFFLHELLHAQGAGLHTPSNGLDYTHGGKLSTWDALLQGWTDDLEYYCLNANELTTPIDLTIASHDIPNIDKKKSILIRLSNHEIIYIESRRYSEWTSSFWPGMAAITATYYDSSRIIKRVDTWLDGSDSREFSNFPSYNLRIVNPNHPIASANTNSIFGGLGDQNILAYEGENFSFRGINITLLNSGNYDTVRIEVDKEKFYSKDFVETVMPGGVCNTMQNLEPSNWYLGEYAFNSRGKFRCEKTAIGERWKLEYSYSQLASKLDVDGNGFEWSRRPTSEILRRSGLDPI